MAIHTVPVAGRVVVDVEIPANAPWSIVIRKGQTLRIIDSHGQQAVDTLFYSADDYHERYSGQDTIRAQGSAYVSTGTRLMSNEGRVMLRDHRRHLRPARHVCGRLLVREQHRALRPWHKISPCLPRQLPARGGETRLDRSATSCRTSTSS